LVDAEGKLSIHETYEQDYRRELEAYKDSGKVWVVLQPYKKTRSLLQNAYYWGVIVKILSDFTGHYREEVHDAMKLMFLSYEDDGIRYVKSTSHLTVAEAEEYYERIRQWAAIELGVYIPDPESCEEVHDYTDVLRPEDRSLAEILKKREGVI